MSIHALISKVCELPRDFYEVRTKSVIKLLREAEYFDRYNEVSLDAVRTYIAAKPTLVHDWAIFADDSHDPYPSGWWFSEDGTVKHMPEGTVLRFDNAVTACAEFIIRKLEEIRRDAG